MQMKLYNIIIIRCVVKLLNFLENRKHPVGIDITIDVNFEAKKTKHHLEIFFIYTHSMPRTNRLHKILIRDD